MHRRDEEGLDCSQERLCLGIPYATSPLCSSLRRPSTQLDLSLNPRNSSGRYKPYSQRSRAKELATPGSLNLMNQPALTASKLRGQRAVPKYTTPMSSPGLLPTLSPTVHGKPGITSSASSMGMSLPLPSISLNSAPTTTSSSGGMQFFCFFYYIYIYIRNPFNAHQKARSNITVQKFLVRI